MPSSLFGCALPCTRATEFRTGVPAKLISKRVRVPAVPVNRTRAGFQLSNFASPASASTPTFSVVSPTRHWHACLQIVGTWHHNLLVHPGKSQEKKKSDGYDSPPRRRWHTLGPLHIDLNILVLSKHSVGYGSARNRFTLEARKLEYDCPPNPKALRRRKTSLKHPGSIFQLFLESTVGLVESGSLLGIRSLWCSHIHLLLGCG